MSKVLIWVDGGCDPNPGVGGWGVVLKSGEHSKELYGGESDSTNNRMEITAAIMGLRALKFPCDVVLHSDSQYVINTMSKGWKRRTNLDLWQQLDDAAAPHTVEWVWVRGHVGNVENERAHDLSMLGIREARRAS